MKFSCPACHQILEVGDDLAGRSVSCPACAQPIVVPRGAAPAARAWSGPPIKSRPAGGGNGLMVLAALAVVAAGAAYLFRAEISRHLGGKGGTAPTPAAVAQVAPPEATPISATPAPTPAPVVVAEEPRAPAAPPMDALEWVLASRERWPQEVVLLAAVKFPAVVDGKIIGSAQVKAGTPVKVVEITKTNVAAVYGGGGARVPIESTDLRQRAAAEMAKGDAAAPPGSALGGAATTSETPTTLAATTAPVALPPRTAGPGPIRVLFLGHENAGVHNSSNAVATVMRVLGRDAIYFDYATTPDCLNRATLSQYDALMLYANHETITPEQFAALKEFIESGHGFLPIHCASACFGNEPKFAALVGGRFKSHGAGVFKPRIVERGFPIMQGVQEYETWDESYVHDQHNAQGRKVLAQREDEPWTWVRAEGRGRIFYTASGHDQRTWDNADFQLLLKNAIVWAVGDTVKQGWSRFVSMRESEKRGSSANIPNYEKRNPPPTLQQPFTPKGSMQRTQVPVDMRLELFASEPQIGKPIALGWDERGRCWVAETRDYPHDVTPSGEGRDTLRICEDTNGDGRADKFTVFAEKLNIPTSFVFANGGVIVAQPPRFLFLKDLNGDDKADVREVVLQGWGVGDTHAQASSLHYGYDNWLHGCVGYSGFKGNVGGKEMGFGQGTYRFKADGSALEFLHQFSNNSWGHSFNAAGDDFGGTANNAPIFYGGIPQTVVPGGMRAMTAKKINVEDKAHAISPNMRQVDVIGGFTAAAGSAFMYSANLPPRLQGRALVCEPTMKLIAIMNVQPQGAGYVAKDGFNLVASSDEWMSPVFAEVGPDGAVWFADWQNFIIQHNPTPTKDRAGYDGKGGARGAHENPLRDHTRGRIYRVIWNGARTPAIRSLKGASTAQLVQALSNDNPFWRLTAQRLLVDGKRTDAAAALKAVAIAGTGNIAAIHALWTLHGLGQLDAATHKTALLAKDPILRRNAIRALGTDAGAGQLFTEANVAADPDSVTKLAAMVKLAQFPESPAISGAVTKLDNDTIVSGDEWLREALKIVKARHQAGPVVETIAAGDAKRGEEIFFKHPAVACVTCHILKGKGSAIGPALDGIAKTKDAKYLEESLLEPSKVLAKGFEQMGMSPMPPMGVVLKPQEVEDVKAFLLTLK